VELAFYHSYLRPLITIRDAKVLDPELIIASYSAPKRHEHHRSASLPGHLCCTPCSACRVALTEATCAQSTKTFGSLMTPAVWLQMGDRQTTATLVPIVAVSPRVSNRSVVWLLCGSAVSVLPIAAAPATRRFACGGACYLATLHAVSRTSSCPRTAT
jgi:hypothetical protein